MRWALLGLLLLAPVVTAHLLNMSTSTVTLQRDGGVEVSLELDLLRSAGSRETYFNLSLIDAPLSDPAVQALLAPLPNAVRLEAAGQRIPLRLVAIEFADASRDVYLDPFEWPLATIRLRGERQATEVLTEAGLVVRFDDSFRFEEPIANTIIDEQSQLSQTRWLVSNQNSPTFDASSWLGDGEAPAAERSIDWAGLASFLWAGFSHILPMGADHLMFVAALVLGARSTRNLIWIISAFTVAHSLTLAAGVLGWVDVPAMLVEAAILLSIAWVSLANLLRASAVRSSLLLVLLFGLLHGFGFASALASLELPSDQRVLSLVAFNLGVEFGQLAFLAVLLAGFLLLNRRRSEVADERVLPVSSRDRRVGSSIILALTFVMLLVRFGLS